MPSSTAERCAHRDLARRGGQTMRRANEEATRACGEHSPLRQALVANRVMCKHLRASQHGELGAEAGSQASYPSLRESRALAREERASGTHALNRTRRDRNVLVLDRTRTRWARGDGGDAHATKGLPNTTKRGECDNYETWLAMTMILPNRGACLYKWLSRVD